MSEECKCFLLNEKHEVKQNHYYSYDHNTPTCLKQNGMARTPTPIMLFAKVITVPVLVPIVMSCNLTYCIFVVVRLRVFMGIHMSLSSQSRLCWQSSTKWREISVQLHYRLVKYILHTIRRQIWWNHILSYSA